MMNMARDQHGDRDAVRITTASASRNEEIAGRQRRYVISMSIRTICFVAAILVGPGWLRWVLVAAALLLPYVAVVMANATHSKSDDFALRSGAAVHPELDAPGNPPLTK
jgi:Mn2+/Fe2+ NRAMP family transporter